MCNDPSGVRCMNALENGNLLPKNMFGLQLDLVMLCCSFMYEVCSLACVCWFDCLVSRFEFV